jgi:hypothetical protein
MAVNAKSEPDDLPRRRRRRATFNKHGGVRQLMAAYDLNEDKMYGHIKTKKDRTTFLEFCRYLRTLYPSEVRIAIVLDNFSPHLDEAGSTSRRVGRGEQRRTGLLSDQYQLAESDRSPVPGPPLFHAGRDRPPVTR